MERRHVRRTLGLARQVPTWVYRSALLASASLVAMAVVAAPVTVDHTKAVFTTKHAVADSCFVAGTMVTMADGTEKPIEEVSVGDRVIGRHGRTNRVVGLDRTLLGPRFLFAFNGGRPFVTAEHPFMTPGGWKSLNPAATQAETTSVPVSRLGTGDLLVTLVGNPDVAASHGSLALRPGPAYAEQLLPLVRITGHPANPHLPLFNLWLDGDHTYVADGYLVHNKDGGGDGDGDGGDGDGGDGDGGDGDGGDGDGGDGDGGDGDGGDGDGGDGGGGDGDGGDGDGDSGEGDDGGGGDGESDDGGGDDGDNDGDAGTESTGDDGSASGATADDADSGASSAAAGGGESDGAVDGAAASAAAFSGSPVAQQGPDLSPDEEAAAIGNGWSN